MAVNDVIELLLVGNGLGVPLISNFTYEQTAGSPDALLSGLVTLFVNNVLPEIVNVVNHNTTFTEVQAKTIRGGDSVYVLGLSTDNVGLVSGDCMPPEICWTFRYFRASAASRNGAKRIGLVSEADVTNGEPASGEAAVMADVAASFQAILSGSGYEWTPRILRKRLNGEPVDPVVVFPVSSVGFVGVTTQNSRKFNKH